MGFRARASRVDYQHYRSLEMLRDLIYARARKNSICLSSNIPAADEIQPQKKRRRREDTTMCVSEKFGIFLSLHKYSSFIPPQYVLKLS
jgi:hypothetical protein